MGFGTFGTMTASSKSVVDVNSLDDSLVSRGPRGTSTVPRVPSNCQSGLGHATSPPTLAKTNYRFQATETEVGNFFI